MLDVGLEEEDFYSYRGIIDGLKVKVWGFFTNPKLENLNVDILISFFVELESPKTSESRFLFFVKLNDFIAKVYGEPDLSLFEDARDFLQNNSLPAYRRRKGFKNYVSAKDYRDLIIQSESTLIGEDSYYNSWRRDWDREDYKLDVIGTASGRARIELKKEMLRIVYEGKYE